MKLDKLNIIILSKTDWFINIDIDKKGWDLESEIRVYSGPFQAGRTTGNPKS